MNGCIVWWVNTWLSLTTIWILVDCSHYMRMFISDSILFLKKLAMASVITKLADFCISPWGWYDCCPEPVENKHIKPYPQIKKGFHFPLTFIDCISFAVCIYVFGKVQEERLLVLIFHQWLWILGSNNMHNVGKWVFWNKKHKQEATRCLRSTHGA